MKKEKKIIVLIKKREELKGMRHGWCVFVLGLSQFFKAPFTSFIFLFVQKNKYKHGVWHNDRISYRNNYITQ